MKNRLNKMDPIIFAQQAWQFVSKGIDFYFFDPRINPHKLTKWWSTMRC